MRYLINLIFLTLFISCQSQPNQSEKHKVSLDKNVEEIIQFYDSYLDYKYPNKGNKSFMFINDWRDACENQNFDFIKNDSIFFSEFLDTFSKKAIFSEILTKKPKSVKPKSEIKKWYNTIHKNEFKTGVDEHLENMEDFFKENPEYRDRYINENDIYYINWGGVYYYHLYNASLESDKKYRRFIEFLVCHSPSICGQFEFYDDFLDIKENENNPVYKLLFFSELFLRPMMNKNQFHLVYKGKQN